MSSTLHSMKNYKQFVMNLIFFALSGLGLFYMLTHDRIEDILLGLVVMASALFMMGNID